MNLFTDAQHIAGLRRFGVLTAGFFLVKGLLWVAAPFIFLLFS